MTEEEARKTLRTHGGWTWRIRNRNRQAYIYAERWGKMQKKEERYIAPLAHLPHLTAADLIAKLTK